MDVADDSRSDTKELFEEVPEEPDSAKSQPSSWTTTITNYVILGSSPVLLALSAASAQSLGGTIPPFELNFWRYLAEFLIVAPPLIILIIRGTPKPDRSQALWLVAVGAISSAFNIFYYTSTIYLAVGTAGCMTNGLTVILTSVGTLIMGECAKYQTVAVILSTAGAVLLSQPGFNLEGSSSRAYNPYCKPVGGSTNRTDCFGDNNNCSADHDNFGAILQVVTGDPANGRDTGAQYRELIGYGMVLGAAISLASAYVIVNKKLHDLGSLVLNAALGAFGVVASLLAMAVFETPTLPGSAMCAYLLLGHAFGVALANIAITTSLQRIKPMVVSLVTLLNAVLLFVAQYTILKSTSPGKQNAAEVAGAVIIVVSNTIIPVYKLCTLNHDGNRKTSLKPK